MLYGLARSAAMYTSPSQPMNIEASMTSFRKGNCALEFYLFDGMWRCQTVRRPTEWPPFTEGRASARELGEDVVRAMGGENHGMEYQRMDTVIARAVAAFPGIPFIDFLCPD